MLFGISYNVIIYGMRDTSILNTSILRAPYISFNGYFYKKDKTILGFFIYIEYLDKIIINALNQASKQPDTNN